MFETKKVFEQIRMTDSEDSVSNRNARLVRIRRLLSEGAKTERELAEALKLKAYDRKLLHDLKMLQDVGVIELKDGKYQVVERDGFEAGLRLGGEVAMQGMKEGFDELKEEGYVLAKTHTKGLTVATLIVLSTLAGLLLYAGII